jgi:hypothetical protein
MNTPDLQTPSRSDSYEKTLNGIDLCNTQSNLHEVESLKQDQNFYKIQKSHSKFSSSGLWRKKRDIAPSKTLLQS